MRAAHRIPLLLTGLLAGVSGTAASIAAHGQPGAFPAARARVADAGGAAATQTVGFTVAPAILVVVDRGGRPSEIFTNLRRRPTAAELAAARVRRGSQRGPGASVTGAVRAALAAVRWGRPGLVWRAPRG